MSVVEYHSLIFEISQRLDEMNVGRKLIVMCRGKVAPRSDENMQDAFSLFVELEEREFLGPDYLDVLKDLIKGVKEWALLEEVEKFESKRKEYNDLLKHIIRVLDGLNDVERLLSICKEKIPQERQSNIVDVRSLFKELENNNCLGINRLDIVKEILAQTEKTDLLKAVKEFEERRTLEDKFERRKARAAAILSTAWDNLTGVLNVKTVFKGIAGGIVIASAFELLRRGSTYDQLVTAINTCVLPAGAKLIQITEGSLNLKVQAENRLAVDSLWRMYKNGTLKARLEALLVTDEMRELVGGEGVEVIVTIDEQEYEKAWSELTVEGRDALSKRCLKDVRKEVTDELAFILESDPVALGRFCQSFGLDKEELRTRGLWDIKQFFPDTPVKVLKDVFEALKLFDLAELLEKETKPKALRPALSLKEIEKLPSASDRPTKIYTKAEVLIIRCSEEDGAEAEKFGSFFKDLNKESQVTILEPKSTGDSCKELNMFNMRRRTLTKDIHVAKIKQKGEKAKKENEKFQVTVSSHIDKWIEQAQDKGNESTLFVLRVMNHDRFEYGVRSLECTATIEAWVEEKLNLIPNTKVVMIDSSLPRMMKMVKIPRETLQVYLLRPIGHGKILELLNKRYKSLDLIAVMLEAKRTFSSRYRRSRIHGHDVGWHYPPWHYDPAWHYPTEYIVEIQENLTCLPLLQKKG